MEPIDFLRAPLRRWPVVLVGAVIGAIIAVLVPVSSAGAYSSNMWQANAEVGLTPADSANSLGSKISSQQLQFYARQPAVIKAAAQADHIRYVGSLKKDIMTSKPGHGMKGIIDVAVLQPTRSAAASLTNAFVTVLGTYINQQLSAQYQTSLNNAQARITNLENALTVLNGKSTSSSSSSSTTTTSTTTTTAPRSSTTTTVPASTTTTTKPTKSKSTTTTTTKPESTTTTVSSSRRLPLTGPGSPGRITLAATYIAAGSTSGTTTTTTSPTTTTTSPTTTTTTAGSVTKKELNDEKGVLATDLAGALSKQASLLAAGTPVADYAMVAAAKASAAVLVPGGPPLLAHRSVRGPLGLLVGALVGVGAAYLVEGSDRRLRTAERASEVFGLPVVTEVPGEAPAISRSKEPVIPVVDVVSDPYSAKAEAYRKLHVAVRTAPLVTWVKRGGPSLEDFFELASQRQTPALSTGAVTHRSPSAPIESLPPGASAPPSTSGPSADVGLPAVVRRGPHQDRFAILVTSPGDEPTRSFVVANLAAVFAEAGDRVLVATTGGLRTAIALNERPWGPSASMGPDPDATTIVASARPSQIPGVSSLALGQLFQSPSKLASKAPSLVLAAREVVDVLILEASLLSTQDGEALLSAVDVVVVVCESWYTTVSDGVHTQRLLARHRPPVLGLAMTNVPPPRPPGPQQAQGGNGTRRVSGYGGPSDEPTGRFPPQSGYSPPSPPPPSGYPTGQTVSYSGTQTGGYTGTFIRTPPNTRTWSDEGSSAEGSTEDLPPPPPEDPSTPL